MVKNYLVGAVRPVIKKWFSHDAQGATVDNENRDIDIGHYDEMYRVSRASAKKYLQGEWTEICHRAPCLDARLFQIAQWYLVKEMWFKEPCNILCMGSDTLFVRDTEMFGEWEEMRIFNYTDPRSHRQFPHYFNDDVRYFPSTMDPAVWELGERRMYDWFSHAQAHWDCGQLIHNAMFWSQPIADDDRLHPYLNWMSHGLRTVDPRHIDASSQWNRCGFENAKIMHFNGSRGAAATVDAMKQFAQHFEVDV